MRHLGLGCLTTEQSARADLGRFQVVIACLELGVAERLQIAMGNSVCGPTGQQLVGTTLMQHVNRMLQILENKHGLAVCCKASHSEEEDAAGFTSGIWCITNSASLSGHWFWKDAHLVRQLPLLSCHRHRRGRDGC